MAACGWMGCRGATGWFKRRSAGHLGEGAGMEGHGDHGGLAAWPFRGRVAEGKKLTGGVRLPVRERGAG